MNVQLFRKSARLVLFFALALGFAAGAVSVAQAVGPSTNGQAASGASTGGSVLPLGAARTATTSIYTTSTNGTSLATIDSVTGVGTEIGPFGQTGGCLSLAFDTNGTVYVACAANLYTANATTGALTLVGTMSAAAGFGLEFDSTGQLWSASGSNLYKVNKATGATTLVGAMGVAVDPMDLAFSPGGTLYMIEGNGSRLFTLNTTSGAATLVGTLSVQNIMGLMFDSGGTLFGTNFANPGNLYTINTTTAVATLVGSTGLDSPHGGSFFVAPPSPTTTTLASSKNPSSIGQQVTFTATVAPTSGSGTPTGTVAFKDGGTDITGCGTQALSGGQATCSTSALTLGSHNITAVYGGDTNFIGSTSNTVAQVVNQISTTTLVSSKNPSTFGQSVTFTVTVSGSGGTPTGTVTFKDGATTLGSGAVNGSGQATFTTSALAIGSHSITAEYGGDATFGASTSSALSQAVGNAMLYLPLVVR